MAMTRKRIGVLAGVAVIAAVGLGWGLRSPPAAPAASPLQQARRPGRGIRGTGR